HSGGQKKEGGGGCSAPPLLLVPQRLEQLRHPDQGGGVVDDPARGEGGQLRGGASAQLLNLAGELPERPRPVAADLGIAGGRVRLQLAEQGEAVADERGVGGAHAMERLLGVGGALRRRAEGRADPPRDMVMYGEE